MKRLLLITAACFAAGCSTAATSDPVAQNSNVVNEPMRTERMRSTIEHTTENQPSVTPPTSGPGGGKWSASGDPIDTAKFDIAIAAAEKNLKAKPADAAAKSAAVEAYFERGFALTEARQYASALGDYRRALKIDPGHAESLKWEKQIIGIYEMLKKDYPKPGEEPPPLPFKSEPAKT